MASQIHIAGSICTRVSRQLENSSFSPPNSITRAPTAKAKGANSGRERLSRITASRTAASSLTRMAWMSRRIWSRLEARAGWPSPLR
ncbi:MAG TPA: hypothetical protein DHU96_24155 [Actinobacteria bacterium]|nr:hypothetical protein [Actinomycetota bacterium]